MRIANYNSPAAENIAKIIKEKGLKQVYVAEKAGYGKQELNDMLNGRRLIKACDILKLSITLGVTANDIYEAGKEVKL
ncbi:MAG: helix-turn-helix transcriptional regulator [Hespellia sp.]|nr:helix-turn-helix transcriptional regulator [Hespellia sp.]